MAESRTGGWRPAVEIEQAIAELQRRWPAHSVPPALIQRLEELEDELVAARRAVSDA